MPPSTYPATEWRTPPQYVIRDGFTQTTPNPYPPDSQGGRWEDPPGTVTSMSSVYPDSPGPNANDSMVRPRGLSAHWFGTQYPKTANWSAIQDLIYPRPKNWRRNDATGMNWCDAQTTPQNQPWETKEVFPGYLWASSPHVGSDLAGLWNGYDVGCSGSVAIVGCAHQIAVNLLRPHVGWRKWRRPNQSDPENGDWENIAGYEWEDDEEAEIVQARLWITGTSYRGGEGVRQDAGAFFPQVRIVPEGQYWLEAEGSASVFGVTETFYRLYHNQFTKEQMAAMTILHQFNAPQWWDVGAAGFGDVEPCPTTYHSVAGPIDITSLLGTDNELALLICTSQQTGEGFPSYTNGPTNTSFWGPVPCQCRTQIQFYVEFTMQASRYRWLYRTPLPDYCDDALVGPSVSTPANAILNRNV
jgi:hypothetical protein